MPPKKKHLPKMLVHKYVEEKIEESDATKKAKHTFDGATSIYSCTTHADKFLKFDGSNKNIAHCKSCGSKIFGQHGFLTCTTAGCFFLCSSCKICRQNHLLAKVYAFKQSQGTTNHINNAYSCNVCQEEKELNTTQGVYHCIPCDYSVCPSCMTYERNLWIK